MQDDTQPQSPLGLGLDEGATPEPLGGTQTPISSGPVTSDEANQPGQTPPSPKVTSDDESKLVVTSSSPPKKSVSARAIATILGILLLVGSVATGVYLVQRQQLISTRAWDCRTYIFNVSRDGIVSVQNGSTRDEPSQQALVYINDSQVAVINVPALKAGSAATLGSVNVPQSAFSWRVKGTRDCDSSGRYEAAKVNICHVPPGAPETAVSIEVDKNAWEEGHDPHNAHSLDFLIDNNHPCPPTTPTPSPGTTITPTTTNTPTPSPLPEISADCLNIKAYDTNWNLLSSNDLSKLTPGKVVRFAVEGSASSGSFDKARFIINGNQRPEVNNKKPGSNEFYDEYTIPVGTSSFNVNANIHHSSLGWF